MKKKNKKHLGYVDALSFHHTVFFHLNICSRSDSSELCVLARLREPLCFCIMNGDFYVGKHYISDGGAPTYRLIFASLTAVNKNNVHLLCVVSFAPLLLQPGKKKKKKMTTNSENKQRQASVEFNLTICAPLCL